MRGVFRTLFFSVVLLWSCDDDKKEQSANSEHHDDLVEDYLSNTPFELLFDRAAVDAAAVMTLTLYPAP